MDAESMFATAMSEYGLMATALVADGKIHRFDGPDEKRGRGSCWYVLHSGDPVPAGSFGDWRTGLSQTWCGKPDRALTDDERRACRQRIEQSRREAEAERELVARDARSKVAEHWESAGAVRGDHPYVTAKRIRPYGARQIGTQLLIPLYDSSGTLQSAQYIQQNGAKRFKSGGRVAGCFCMVGDEPKDGGTVLIAEGWATACTLREATSHTVFAAMNAGNLAAVARALRAKYPSAHIVICADDDFQTEGNPGMSAAAEAVKEIGSAKVAVPEFCANRPDTATDFNDLAMLESLDVVRACVDKAVDVAPAPLSPAAVEAAEVSRSSQPPLAPTALAEAAIERTIAGDAGALFEIVDVLRDIRAKHAAAYARVRARIRKECRAVSIGALEREMRSDVDAADEKSVADLLIDLADERCELFHDPDRAAFALLDGGGYRQCWPVRSDGFREWLSYSFYQQHGRAPTDASITTALATIEGKAKFDGEEQRTHLRVASEDGSIWIDLCNESWQAIEVTSTGWRLVDEPPLRFVRTATMRPLPMPTQGGSLAPLWDIVNIPESERLLVITWMLECFRSATPYAVLELTGEQGSAKSTTQHYLRELIDPNRSNNRAAPKNVDDVFVAAQNAHLMSFENLSHLAANYQDALCVLATGGGYSTRRLFTNADETVLDLKKPIALNGIAVIVTAQDLSDRAVHIDLPTIEARATANQIQQAFETHRCGIFGALLDVLARALAQLQDVRTENLKLPRMADFAQLGEAVYRVHGRQPGEFLTDYQEKRRESVHRTLEASPVAMAILAYLNANSGGFEGTIGRLLEVLSDYRQDTEAWPKSAKGMGDAFRRIMPALRQIGIAAWTSNRPGMHGYKCGIKKMPERAISSAEVAT